MSGVTIEYVMGNYSKTAGESGLTISTIPTQHIDIYYGEDVSASHLGDATGETAGWYSGEEYFVHNSSSWFERCYGLFDFYNLYDGAAYSGSSFRVILSVKE